MLARIKRWLAGPTLPACSVCAEDRKGHASELVCKTFVTWIEDRPYSVVHITAPRGLLELPEQEVADEPDER